MYTIISNTHLWQLSYKVDRALQWCHTQPWQLAYHSESDNHFITRSRKWHIHLTSIHFLVSENRDSLLRDKCCTGFGPPFNHCWTADGFEVEPLGKLDISTDPTLQQYHHMHVIHIPDFLRQCTHSIVQSCIITMHVQHSLVFRPSHLHPHMCTCKCSRKVTHILRYLLNNIFAHGREGMETRLMHVHQCMF